MFHNPCSALSRLWLSSLGSPLRDRHRKHWKNSKRGARFVTNNYTMESGNSQQNLHSLGWTTLEERRLQLKLSTFKKAHLKLLDLPLENCRPKTRQTRQGGVRLEFYRPFSPINSHINSFFHQTTQIRNLLPVAAKTCDDMSLFNNEISKISLTRLKNSFTLWESAILTKTFIFIFKLICFYLW